MEYIEPLKILIYNEKAIRGIDAKGFGGFCECNGTLIQKTWHEINPLKILVAECENCWETEALIFSGKKLIERKKVKTIKRKELKDFLSKKLSESELEAILNKARGLNYNYSSFSRARKKLEKMGIDVREILKELIF